MKYTKRKKAHPLFSYLPSANLPNPYLPSSSGFSLIELIVVMGFFMTIFALAFVSLNRTQQSANINSKVISLANDLQNEQLKAMNLDTEGQSSTNPHGIRFEQSRYILFTGPAYNSNSEGNIIIDLEYPLEFSGISLPDASVIFEKGTGEVVGFNSVNNMFRLTNMITTEEKTFTINRIGVITSIN